MSILTPLTSRLPSDAGRQCRAFLCVRDEAERLPYVLSYHRKLGVQWFFIIDNGSRDGTLEFLSEQPDCSVFTTAASYAEATFGMDWINILLDQFGIGHWCLFIDADELLVYPHVEEMMLPEFCRSLERQQAEGVYAFMLDMYADGPIADAAYRRGDSFLATSPLFDMDYEFRKRPRLPLAEAPFPAVGVVGGPRLRRFYPEFLDASFVATALPRGITKLRSSWPGRALRADRWLPRRASPPLLSKVPLILGAPGRHYRNSHKTVPLKLARTTAVLLHFKFFADFHRRATKAITEGQHYDGGSEYARYIAALAVDPALSLSYAGSRRYRSSDQLIEHGLLRADPSDGSFRLHAAEAGPGGGALHEMDDMALSRVTP